MTVIRQLAVFLGVMGIGLTAGPFYFYRAYQKSIQRLNNEDLLDDPIRKRGTVLFILGGLSFLGAAVILWFL